MIAQSHAGKKNVVARLAGTLKKVGSSKGSLCQELAALLLARRAAAAFNAPNLRIEGQAKILRRASWPRMSLDPTPVGVQAALEAASQVDVQAALDAATPALKSAADAVGSVASASAPVLSGAAAVGGTVAKGLIPVIKKGVEVTAPVLQEGVKAAVPLAQEGLKVAGKAINDGQLSEEAIESLSSAATLPTPEAMSEFGASPLGVALQGFAPYFFGVVLLYLATQAAISKVVEAVQPLVLPTASLVVLGFGLQAGFSFGLIQVPEFLVQLPQRVGLASSVALALYVTLKFSSANEAEPSVPEVAIDPAGGVAAPNQTDETAGNAASQTTETTSAVESTGGEEEGVSTAVSEVDGVESALTGATDAADGAEPATKTVG